MQQETWKSELAIALFLGVNAMFLLAAARFQSWTQSARTKSERNSQAVVRESASKRVLRGEVVTSHSPVHHDAPTDRIELLVHNVSHADMVLSLDSVPSDTSRPRDAVLSRPKFNFYSPISNKILSAVQALEKEGTLSVVDYPVYTRHPSTRKFPIKKDMENYRIPVGFELPERSDLEVEDLNQLRFRRDDRSKILSKTARINGCYFPLLSVLGPKWARMVHETGRTHARRVLILVTGVGTPRDAESNITDNSTRAVAQLMKIYIQMTHPEIHEVVHVHSTTNIFRYYENILFVKDELLPKINQYRNELAVKYGARWSDLFHLTISFADGSPARITAINASLRSYRPSYMHFWQLKTFWHETKVCEDDVEIHSFEEIETIPPVGIEDIGQNTKILVNAMLEYKNEFINMVRNEIANDVLCFWLRKTKKLVLAVLLVQKPGSDEVKIYRGTNMEVSMPTGSLCAERNTIGTALGNDLTLRRQDLKMIAVLSVPLRKMQAEYEASTPTRSPGRFHNDSLPASPQLLASSSSTSFPPPFPFLEASLLELPPPLEEANNTSHNDLPSPLLSPQRSTSDNSVHVPASPNTRLTKIRGYNRTESDVPTLRKVKTITVEETDLNPLKPCGACNEWLKKIAEVNPEFAVVTFTDVHCSGVFIEHIVLS